MKKDIKIVVDEDIPFIKGVLEPFASVSYFKGNKIGPSEISEADALIVRTRTKCDSSLLKGSSVKFIASATIGKDHVDQEYCRENGIFFTNAAGCNAWGVVQYVLAAIYSLADKKGFDVTDKTIGIIGAGNVGERLASTCESLGLKVLRCDPPVKEMLENKSEFVTNGSFSVDRSSLSPEQFYDIKDVVQKADIITLHVPLLPSTKSLFNKELFSKMKPGAVFINSSRGEVVDESALILARQKLSGLVLDVWCNEPGINSELLKFADIATPHIAGYSLEGKINATIIVVREISKYFGINELQGFSIDYPSLPIINSENLFFLLRETFPIFEEDKKLRENPSLFEKIRSSYSYRREISREMYMAFSANKTIKIC